MEIGSRGAVSEMMPDASHDSLSRGKWSTARGFTAGGCGGRGYVAAAPCALAAARLRVPLVGPQHNLCRHDLLERLRNTRALLQLARRFEQRRGTLRAVQQPKEAAQLGDPSVRV